MIKKLVPQTEIYFDTRTFDLSINIKQKNGTIVIPVVYNFGNDDAIVLWRSIISIFTEEDFDVIIKTLTRIPEANSLVIIRLIKYMKGICLKDAKDLFDTKYRYTEKDIIL